MNTEMQGDSIIRLVNVNKWVRKVPCAAQHQPRC